MNLPNFISFEPLNELRRQMGGAQLGEILAVQLGERLSVEELVQLSKQGIEISPTEIEFLPDGTLAYKGRRIILHIRDVEEYSNKPKDLPKFHVAHCRTLEQMLQNNRFERYVVATRTDGVFKLKQKKAWERRFTDVDSKLDVCQNCLEQLVWNGFSMLLPRTTRRAAVAAFSIASYFEKYGSSIFKQVPKYSDQDAPVNEYSPDFAEISNRTRRERGWTCEACGINLSSVGDRQYLHIHHKNGTKSDNSPSNLLALCIACHSRQPGHAHVRYTGALRNFFEAHPMRRRVG